MFYSSTSQPFERPVPADMLASRRDRSFPAMLIPALLLALVLARMLGLGLSMRHAAGPATALAPAGMPGVAGDVAELGAPFARAGMAGVVMPESAILFDDDATRTLPLPGQFISEDAMPFQLRTSDLTTDLAICTGMPRGEATGGYRFDFLDGGLSWGEPYSFFTFVTQTYRPASLSDTRLLLVPRVEPPGWDARYVSY